MIRAFVAAVAALLLSAPAHAAGCMTIDAAQAQAATHGLVLHALTGDQITRAGEVFNTTPPVSDIPVDSAAYAAFPDNAGGVLLVGPGLQLCAHMKIPPARYDALIRYLLEGDGA
jgi:hypothetical protein